MNARTPALSPVLPQLISSLAAQLRRAEQRLAAATSADADSTFVVADRIAAAAPLLSTTSPRSTETGGVLI
jgi:hypothetical protein